MSVRIFVICCFLLSAAGLAAPAIGIATASGHFSVEGSQVWGNATLFDGAMVETSSASSAMTLRNGVQVQLAAGSRARIWQNRLVLEKGVAQLAAPASFEARVADSARLIRAVFPGPRNVSFFLQARHVGCLVYKDGRYILQDQNTQEVIELVGPNLAPGLSSNVGNRVEVSGTASTTRPGVAIATSVINVTSVSPQSQGGCLSVAAALDARTDAPAPGAAGVKTTPAPKPSTQGGGMSTGAKVAIIAAVGGGGAGAAIALAGKKKSTSP